MDETIYQRNSRLWFEGKRPSSRDTPNPVEILMIGDKKPSHVGAMDFLDNSLDQSSGTLRGRALVKNQEPVDILGNSAGFGSLPVRRTRGCCCRTPPSVRTSRARSSLS